jgi:hypothetical protein
MEMKPEIKSVILDFVFLTVDWMGALFSLLALGKALQYFNFAEKHLLTSDVAVQHTFDVLGSVLYILWYVTASGSSTTCTDFFFFFFF